MSNLREEIAIDAYDICRRCSDVHVPWEYLKLEDKETWLHFADSTLALTDQHFDELARERGYVKLGDDQGLPENPFERDWSKPFALMDDSDEDKARRGGYYQSQQDMLKANFRKIKEE